MSKPARIAQVSPPYTPVPGSAALRTRSRGDSAEVRALEESERAIPVAREIAGEHLARTLVRDGYIPVLTDVYDRLALSQEAPEQALYGHLYRLAIGDDRNFCRASKSDLMARTRLSERRLLKALAGLVTKGHVSLVHRDKRGTLFRVHLPHEVFDEGADDRVIISGEKHLRRAAPARGEGGGDPARTVAGTPAAGRASGRAEGVGRVSSSGRDHSLQEYTTIGALTSAFCAAYGGPGRDPSSVLEEVLGRMEEGRSLREVASELELFARKAPKKVPITELGRFLERV
jgi:hypothetical protein